jgi:hypothetical protein
LEGLGREPTGSVGIPVAVLGSYSVMISSLSFS